MRTFEYSYVTLAEGSIDIEDIGNCVIRATSKFGSIKYLIIIIENTILFNIMHITV